MILISTEPLCTIQVDLTLYDPSKSSTSQVINCDNDFCTSVSNGPVPGCAPGLHCAYQLSYGDGSTTAGYFVKDIVQYDRVSGNRETTPANSTIVLGYVSIDINTHGCFLPPSS